MDNEVLIKMYESKLLELKQSDNILGLAKSGHFPNYSVYLITNDIDDKVYVGITNNIYNRITHHFLLRNHIKESNKELYRHMVHIGVNYFNVSIYQTDIKTKQLAEQLETILIMIYKKQGKSLNGSMSRHTYHTRYLYKNYTYTNNNHNNSLQPDKTDYRISQYINKRPKYWNVEKFTNINETYLLKFVKDYFYMIIYDDVPHNEKFLDERLMFHLYYETFSTSIVEENRKIFYPYNTEYIYSYNFPYDKEYIPVYDFILLYYKYYRLKVNSVVPSCFSNEYNQVINNSTESDKTNRWALIVKNDKLFQTIYQTLNRTDKMRLTKFKRKVIYNG